MHSCSSDFDRDERIQRRDGSLEWLEIGVFIGKNAKLGGTIQVCCIRVSTADRLYRKKNLTIRDAESYARGDLLLVWTEPGIALRLTKNPMKERVVAVIVHGRGGERTERIAW
jgi:hypothetical protein